MKMSSRWIFDQDWKRSKIELPYAKIRESGFSYGHAQPAFRESLRFFCTAVLVLFLHTYTEARPLYHVRANVF